MTRCCAGRGRALRALWRAPSSSSWGWPRRLIALAAGAVGALALPPFGFAPAMIVPMTVAVWLIDGAAEASPSGATRWATLRSAFAIGWWWGFGYFLAGLWWLGAAFLVDADQFLWALPLGVVGLPLFLALFPALGFALARAIWPRGRAAAAGARRRPRRSSEFARANLLTGFPWNEYGMALGQHLWPAQAAAFVGLHGLTLLTVAALRRAGDAALGLAADGSWRRWRRRCCAASALCGSRSRRRRRSTGPKLRLVQPNVAQGAEFSAENGAAILGGYLKLSDRATSPERSGIADVTHLFWPESAFPFILSQDRGALARIVDFLHGGAVLVTGAARAEEDGGRTRYFNSIEVLDRSGLAAERYDKHMLVPFGEYLPLRRAVRPPAHHAVRACAGRLRSGRGLARAAHPRPARGARHGLLRGDLSQRERGARRRHGQRRLYPQPDRRRLVRPHRWPLSAFRAGAAARRSNSACRWCASPTPASPRSSTRAAKCVDEAPLGVEAVIDGALPGALPPTWQARWGAADFPARSPRRFGRAARCRGGAEAALRASDKSRPCAALR